MKKLNLMVFSLVALSLSAEANVIVGRVDVQKVLVSVHQGQVVRDQLKKSYDEKQKILKDEENAFRKLNDDFMKKSSVLSEKEKMKKVQELQEKEMSLREKSNSFEQEIRKQEQQLKTPILEKIKAIVEDAGKSSKVDFIYEPQSASVLWAREEKDLTDEVIANYNKKFPK